MAWREQQQASTATTEVLAHWQTLAAATSSGLPDHRAIDPGAIAAALPRCFLAERIAPGMARIRFAGQTIATALGTDGAGMPLSCLIAPDSSAQFRDIVESCLRAPTRASLSLRSSAGAEAQMLLLPLAAPDQRSPRMIGVLDGRIDGPVRFAITGSFASRLSAIGRPVPGTPHLRVIAGGRS